MTRQQTLNDTHLRLSCLADGDPSPSFVWSSDGVMLSKEPVIEIRKNESDRNYVCQVNNTVGTRSRALIATNNYCEYHYVYHVHLYTVVKRTLRFCINDTP